MPHALMYHGGFEANFSNMKSGAKTFISTDGSEVAIPAWPAEADGLRIGYMEKTGKKFVAVRVMHGKADVMLENEMVISPPSHMGHGKRFSPEPTLIDDEPAQQLLKDIAKKNPNQRVALKAIRDRMPWAMKK
jgi:hypothetical protein